MSAVRSKGNRSTEWRLRSGLVRSGVSGWILAPLDVFGHPDFAFKQSQVAVFVDGCFWHGCPHCYRPPKSKKKFWSSKIVQNRRRDRRVNRELAKTGWQVLRIWECQLKKHPGKCIERIRKSLHPKSKPPHQSRKL